MPSARKRVSTATMGAHRTLGLLGAQGPRVHTAVLRDGKGKQAEGRACIKAQDKGGGTWDPRATISSVTQGRGEKRLEKLAGTRALSLLLLASPQVAQPVLC